MEVYCDVTNKAIYCHWLYYKKLYSQCILTAQIAQLQDKCWYYNCIPSCILFKARYMGVIVELKQLQNMF